MLIPALVGCRPPSDTPGTQIFVLVDVSKTWHNPGADDRNLRVLREAGMGTALAADRLSSDTGRAVAVQWRAIGSRSLEREPDCDVVYTKTLVRVTSDKEYQLSSLKELKSYLGTDCPQKMLAGPPENDTEISNAVESVAEQLAIPADSRKIVMLSDFMEEAVAPATPLSLKGFSILMLYRPLSEDQVAPAALRARVDHWKALLESLGATVTAVPDTGIKRDVISEFLSTAPKGAS